MFTATHQRLALIDSFTVNARSWVYQVKYLGVMLDPYLSWNAHIDKIGRKISAKLGMLHKALKVIPRESCLTLYNAMTLSIFDYCVVVWDSCSKADQEHLNKLHRLPPVLLKATQSHNRPFSRWRHLTTTTRIHFVFALLLKFVNPAED